MKKILLITTVMFTATAFAGGGIVKDSKTGLIFDFDNVSQETAIQELQYCQEVALSTQKTVQDPQGTAVRGAARGAAAGAAVGAISGGSGSDAAKVGAAVGAVGGRLGGRNAEQSGHQSNAEAYENVLRNCMIDKKYVALN